MGTAVEVSDGRIKTEEIPLILESKMREKAGITAPPQGLFLEKVHY
jgi:tRNA pseudouridine38-40 synthase